MSMAFFCECCGAGISADDASDAEWKRAEQADFRCDECMDPDHDWHREVTDQ